MRVYLRGAYRAALKALRDDDCADIDRVTAENETAIRAVFDGLMDERYDYAFIRKGRLVHLYTRSARISGVQETTFMDEDGELVPLSDQQYRDAKSWIKDGYPEGCYINVKVA